MTESNTSNKFVDLTGYRNCGHPEFIAWLEKFYADDADRESFYLHSMWAWQASEQRLLDMLESEEMVSEVIRTLNAVILADRDETTTANLAKAALTAIVERIRHDNK